mmetsp:Transcript_90392/g.260435  ORF Transcript_90392/g.260435 Transcript_90392/m.260435 type:complete len:217 (+) Transcript_90392:249-899(+)
MARCWNSWGVARGAVGEVAFTWRRRRARIRVPPRGAVALHDDHMAAGHSQSLAPESVAPSGRRRPVRERGREGFTRARGGRAGFLGQHLEDPDRAAQCARRHRGRCRAGAARRDGGAGKVRESAQLSPLPRRPMGKERLVLHMLAARVSGRGVPPAGRRNQGREVGGLPRVSEPSTIPQGHPSVVEGLWKLCRARWGCRQCAGHPNGQVPRQVGNL